MINEKGSKKEPKIETVDVAIQNHHKKTQKIQSIQNRFKKEMIWERKEFAVQQL